MVYGAASDRLLIAGLLRFHSRLHCPVPSIRVALIFLCCSLRAVVCLRSVEETGDAEVDALEIEIPEGQSSFNVTYNW